MKVMAMDLVFWNLHCDGIRDKVGEVRGEGGVGLKGMVVNE